MAVYESCWWNEVIYLVLRLFLRRDAAREWGSAVGGNGKLVTRLANVPLPS